MKKLSLTLCYKTKNPVIYNEGTQWESKHSTFLFCYLGNTKRETAESICNRLNTEKPSKLWNGHIIDWDEIDYFYLNEQEEMCG